MSGRYAARMSGFDEKTGRINLYEMLPETGDMLVIHNCGDHFTIQHYNVFVTSPLLLTDDEVDRLRQGQIVWN